MTDLPETIWGRKGDSEVTNADVLGFRSPANGANETEYVRADLERARVAAAYEAAAVKCDMIAAQTGQAADRQIDPVRRRDKEAQSWAAHHIAKSIRSLTPDDARAALDRLLAEARAQEREAAWNIPDIELAAILLAYDEAPGCEETFETWRKHWRSRLGQPHDDDTALMDWLEMAQRLAPMVRAAIRARGAAQEGEG